MLLYVSIKLYEIIFGSMGKTLEEILFVNPASCACQMAEAGKEDPLTWFSL
jgi:hypothetical protein